MAATTRTPPSVSSTVRATELDRLLTGVEQAAARRSSVMELDGDPGAGKTRLLTALSQEAGSRGVTVLRGTCAEEHAAVPFHPFIEAFGSRLPGSGRGGSAHPAATLVRRLADPPAEVRHTDFTGRSQFFTELRELLTACVVAAGTGLLLVLDDVHWTDLGSVALLDMLVRRPVTGGLAVVVGHRPRQTPVPLRAVLQRGVERGAVEQVHLGPISVAQSADVLRWEGGTDALLDPHTRAEGNPLYLTVLAADALGREPDEDAFCGLVARLHTETAHLDDTERTAVQAAAVLGGTFDIDGVAEVAGIERDDVCRALDSVRRRDLIRAGSDSGQFTFRHPLIGRALYADSDPCWRAGAHRRAAGRLAALGAPPIRLAPHIERAGASPSESDVAALAGAAWAALHLGRADDAAHWLTVALNLAGTEDPAGRNLWRSVVRALAAHGAGDRIRTVSRAYFAVPPADPAAGDADVAFLATVYAGLGRADEARNVIAAHLACRAVSGPESKAALHVQMQLVQAIAGRVPAWADVEALVRTTRHADPVTAAGAVALHGLCAVLTGDIRTAGAQLDAAAQVYDGEEGTQGPLPPQLPEHLLALGWAEALMGRHAAALGHIERAVPVVRQNGDGHLLAPFLNTLAYTHYQSGSMADALEAAQEARAAGRAVGRADQSGLAEAVISAALAQLGGTTSGRSHPAGTGPTEQAPRTPLDALLHAEAALARGDGAGALSLLLPTGAAWRVSEPVPVLAARGYELLIAAAQLSGAREVAIAEWAESAAEFAAATGLPEQRGHALLARGHLLAHRRKTEEAVETYQEAVELLGAGTPAGVRAGQLARKARSRAGRDGERRWPI